MAAPYDRWLSGLAWHGPNVHFDFLRGKSAERKMCRVALRSPGCRAMSVSHLHVTQMISLGLRVSRSAERRPTGSQT